MNIQTATNGMMDARMQLRTQRGVTDPSFMSEQMQRLCQYTGAIEEHLADLEEELEVMEMAKFNWYRREENKSVNQAETLAKQDMGVIKGQIAKLKRYVNSSWSIIGVAQSRWNHLKSEYQQGGKVM